MAAPCRKSSTQSGSWTSSLLVSSGVGSGDNHAYGVIIAGGHTLALFLTLLATPVAYSLFDDLAVRFSSKARLARLVPPGAPAPAIPEAPES